MHVFDARKITAIVPFTMKPANRTPLLSNLPSTLTHPSLAGVREVKVPDAIAMQQLLELQKGVLLLQHGHAHWVVHFETLLHQFLDSLAPRGVNMLQKLNTA